VRGSVKDGNHGRRCCSPVRERASWHRAAPTHAASVPLPASAFGLQWCAGGAARFGETLRNEDNALRSRAFRFNLEPATRWLRARCRGCSPTT
jgi:hypothetical protein